MNFGFSQLLPISSKLHNLCLLASPKTPWQEYYEAIVCGSELSRSQNHTLLQDLGLLHIIVVSGSHLAFFSIILNKTHFKSLHTIKFSILFFFVLFCKMDPPIFRAFSFLLIAEWCHRQKLFFNSYQILIASVFFCIGAQPHWIFSRSLLLSWAASLGILYGKNILTQSFFCYILLYPLIADFSDHSPYSIIINSTLTPVISLFLFPLSLLSFFLPISSFVDGIWDTLFYICKTLSSEFHIKALSRISAIQLQLQWSYLFLINFICIESKKRNWI